MSGAPLHVLFAGKEHGVKTNGYSEQESEGGWGDRDREIRGGRGREDARLVTSVLRPAKWYGYLKAMRGRKGWVGAEGGGGE